MWNWWAVAEPYINSGAGWSKPQLKALNSTTCKRLAFLGRELIAAVRLRYAN